VFDRARSHIHVGVASEVLAATMAAVHAALEEPIVRQTIDFGRLIGVSNCARTYDGDAIVFARRLHRDGLTRFVTNRKPEPVSLLSVVMRLQAG